MPGCCDPYGFDQTFGGQFARRTARSYRRRGVTGAGARIVRFVEEQGVSGATVLEIGGGVGELQIELLKRGAARATNLELSRGYEDEARELITANGLEGRVERRFVDIAAEPDAVEPADVVILHRVVCCYPDYDGLLSAAAEHARRMVVFSFPPDHALGRAVIAAENAFFALGSNPYRAFAHPASKMEAVLERHGLPTVYRHRGALWRVYAAVREPARSAAAPDGDHVVR
ncbi:MAG TPA: methyltransferase domain-containing protein [Actinomycetales bacterium]|nr:methyltransferase domain-containing protein [Actinomycetales bacterium]